MRIASVEKGMEKRSDMNHEGADIYMCGFRTVCALRQWDILAGGYLMGCCVWWGYSFIENIVNMHDPR